MFETILYYIAFGGQQLTIVFWTSFIFLFLEYIYCIFKSIFLKKDSSKDFKFFKDITILYTVIFGIFIFFGVIIGLLENYVSVGKIIFFDNLFLQIDKVIFGAYLPFWFQYVNNPVKPFFDFLSPAIIFTYYELGFVMGVIFLLLLAVNGKYLYKLALSLFLSFVISVPFWFFFPAISPSDAYYNNIINIPATHSVQNALEVYKPNKSLLVFLLNMKNLDKKYLPVLATTTMPSMHIAWSLLILYFGIKLWRPLAVILVPYFLLNAIATLYLLQHYTIDLPAGLIVGIISIWLANLIAKNKTPQFILDLTEYIQQDIKGIKLLMTPFFDTILNK